MSCAFTDNRRRKVRLVVDGLLCRRRRAYGVPQDEMNFQSFAPKPMAVSSCRLIMDNLRAAQRCRPLARGRQRSLLQLCIWDSCALYWGIISGYYT